MASKIIRSEELADVEHWDRSGMGLSGGSQSGRTVITAQQLEKIHKQAYTEGYESGRREGFEFGHKQGMEAGQGRIDETAALLQSLLGYMEHPFRDLDEQVGQELANLAIAVARQLVRRELHTDPDQVIGVVREALSVLPDTARNVRVRLHPQDAELVREHLVADGGTASWHVIDDPVLNRGDCKVTTETSVVDATLESRIGEITSKVFGGD